MRRKKAKKQGHYCLVYDREGRCTWEAPTSTMNGVPMQIVEVVTKAARKEYLAYLRDMGISCLITEEEEHPVRESLEKALWRGASCPDRRRIH